MAGTERQPLLTVDRAQSGGGGGFYPEEGPTFQYTASTGTVSTQPVEVPTFKGEVPDHDVDEGVQVASPQPSAPSLQYFDPLPGYESLRFDGTLSARDTVDRG